MTSAQRKRRLSIGALRDVRSLATSHAALALLMAIAKVGAGLATGNKALCAAAVFSLQSCLSAWVARAGAAQDIRAEPTSAYDRGKVEFSIIAASSVLILLGVTSLGVALMHSWLAHRQLSPLPVSAAVAVASALVSGVMHNRSRRAAAQVDQPLLSMHTGDLLVDTVISLAVAVSVAMTTQVGPLADSAAAVIAATVLVVSAGRQMHGAVRGLMDASVPAATLDRIAATVRRIDGVSDVRSLRGTHCGHRVSVAMVVMLPAQMRMADAEPLRKRIVKAVMKQARGVSRVLVAFRAQHEARFDDSSISSSERHELA